MSKSLSTKSEKALLATVLKTGGMLFGHLDLHGFKDDVRIRFERGRYIVDSANSGMIYWESKRPEPLITTVLKYGEITDVFVGIN